MNKIRYKGGERGESEGGNRSINIGKRLKEWDESKGEIGLFEKRKINVKSRGR